MKKVLSAVVLAMTLASCSSDDGGSSGGFGTVTPETRAACYNVTGGRPITEPLDNGGSITFNPDCSLVMRTSEGNAHGRFNDLGGNKIQAEITVTSGRYAGCGYQMIATHSNGYLHTFDIWSNDDARCMN